MTLSKNIRAILINNNVEISEIINDKTNKFDSSITLIVEAGNDSKTFSILSRINKIEFKSFEPNKFHITKK